MAGSSIGRLIRLTTFGESHGAALGAVLDGFPAGINVTPEDIQAYLDRRRPGRSPVSTSRNEADAVEILSGVFEGQTTGAPVAMLIRNTSQRSGDYDALKDCYRPGHADYTYDMKYGIRDHRGGGRSSGRETIGRVAGGALCQLLLRELGIDCFAWTESVGDVKADPGSFDRAAILETMTAMPDREADIKARELISARAAEGDSVGGVVACCVKGLPAGIGDPVFDRLDAALAQAVMSIGAVKAVEIGDGVSASSARGSENNDPFMADENGEIKKAANHSGGILGGISDGSPVLLRAHFKPTPSISKLQETVRKDGSPMELSIHGRHDPVIVPRAVVVVESMCALTIADALLINMGARADRIKGFYKSSNS